MKRLLLVLLVTATAAPAAAQTVEITPFAAYRWGGQIDREQTALDADLDVERHGSYGLVVELPLVRDFGGPTPARLSLELSATRQQTDLRTDPGLFGPGSRLSDLDLTYYHGGVALEFPRRHLSPFFTVSAGFTTLEPEAPELDDETRLSGSLGAGAKLWVAPNIGFRFELRTFMTALGEDERFCSRNRCDNDYDVMSQAETRLGLIVSF